MRDASSGPKSGENFWLWFFKITTGPILIILLIIHLIANHLIAEGGLFQWIDVVNYYQVAIVPIMEILFLILVVTHSLLGLRSVILDLKPARSVLKVVDVLFVCAGGISIVYGIWLVLTIVSIGKGG